MKASESRHKREFREEVRAAFSSVVGYCTYLDTIQIITGWDDGARAMHALTAAAIKFTKRTNPNPRLPRSLLIQRPSREILQWLDTNIDPLEPVRVDLAVDFIFGDAQPADAQAAALQGFLAAHIVQPWHGGRRMGHSGSGVYIAGPWQGRNVVVYSDRLSKVVHRPCTHVEMRFFSARQVRKLAASNLEGILDLRPLELMAKQCILAKLDAKYIERRIEQMIEKTMRRCREMGIEMDGKCAIGKKVRSVLSRSLAVHEFAPHPLRLFDAPTQVWLESCRALVGRSIARVPFPAAPLFNLQEDAPSLLSL